MNNFFGDQQTEDRVLQTPGDQDSQEVEETESDLTEEGSAEIASEEQNDYEEEEGQLEEENDFQEQLRQKDAEIEKAKADAQKWVSALQSGYDRQKAEDQRQLAELQNQVQQLIDAQGQSEESSFDEDDYLTGSQMKKFMEQEKKRELSRKEQEQSERKKQEQAELQEAQAWLHSQPDAREVWDFYEKNLKKDPTLNQLNYQAQYFYVKSKMREQDPKPAINKKPKKKSKKENYPPVGNPNRNFSSNSTPSAQGIMEVIENKRKSWGNSRDFFK